MIISAIYFKDKDVCHLKIKQTYNEDHLLVNGQVVQISGTSWKDNDLIIQGHDVEVQRAIKHTTVSHYMNRETEEKISVVEYKDKMASFRTKSGEYKDLESEYMSRKMENMYIAVNRTYFEYEVVPVVFEEAFYNPDKYTKCAGVIKKHDSDKYPDHFVFEFNKWEFTNDIAKCIMEEYGVPCFNSDKEAQNAGIREYYILHDINDYKWLELCGSEYFLTKDDQFGKNDKPQYIYGAYQEVLDAEKFIENNLRKKIGAKLDAVRTVNIKKSTLQDVCDKLDKICKSIGNKKMNRDNIYHNIIDVYYQISDMIKEKR